MERNLKENYERAIKRSLSNTKGEFKENKTNIEISRRVLKIALTCSLLLPIGSAYATKNFVENENVVVPITKEVKDEVDDKISYYEELMRMTSDENNRIENYIGRDLKNNCALVDYNVDNLVKHLVSASQISESEMRCVIISAYRIINEPYLEDVFNRAFLEAIESEDMEESLKTFLENGTEGFLEKLSYEDFDDYRKNERDNIKSLKSLEVYQEEQNGKVM